MFLIISRCESGQSRIKPYNKTLLKGILKRNTAETATMGIRQHKIMIHMCDFFMGKPPAFVECVAQQHWQKPDQCNRPIGYRLL
jgi:hypothetical protein